MAEPNLSLTYLDIQKRVALDLGYTLASTEWDPDQKRQIELVVNDGLARFYRPVSQSAVYEWSFLKPTASLTLASGTSNYDLPDSFEGVVDRFVVLSGSGTSTALELVAYEELIAVRSSEAASNATPRFVAIRPKAASADSFQSTRWEAVFYPTPNATLTVQYHYPVSPNIPTSDASFVLGGAAHAQTIVASCLAYSEMLLKPQSDGARQQDYQARLAASIAFDQRVKDQFQKTLFPITEPAVGHRDWFRRAISARLFQKWNIVALSAAESAQVDLVLDRALQQFYFPAPQQMGEDQAPKQHRWSFLSPVASITTASGDYDYDLPSDFREVVGPLRFAVNAGGSLIAQIPESTIIARLASGEVPAIPLEFAIRAKTQGGSSVQLYELLLSPTPNDVYVLSYTYVRNPSRLSSGSPYPYGGTEHAETILAACMMVAAEGTDQVDAARATFGERLAASISSDRAKISASPDWSTYEPPVGHRDWFRRNISAQLFNKWDITALTTSEAGRVDLVLSRGLLRFYFPPGIQVAEGVIKPSYGWSFLHPNESMSITAGTEDYTFPDDFSSISGQFRFPLGSGSRSISQISEDDLLAKRAVDPRDGIPTEFAIRSRTQDGAAHQLSEVLFYPSPNTSFTLTYSYTRVPPTLSTVAPYPYGGPSHAETILASCLAIAAEGTPEYEARNAVFMDRLSASISADKNSSAEAAKTWSVSKPAYGTYLWLAQILAKEMGLTTMDPAGWSPAEQREVDILIQRGIQQVVTPEIAGMPHHRSHRWSWLYDEKSVTTTIAFTQTGATLDIASGVATMSAGTLPTWAAYGVLYYGDQFYRVTEVLSSTKFRLEGADSLSVAGASTFTLYREEYALGDDVRSIEGPVSYRFGSGIPIQIPLVSPNYIRQQRASVGILGYPQFIGQLVSEQGRVSLTVHPYPDKEYVLIFRVRKQISELGDRDQLPGGEQFAETFLASCMALLSPKYRDQFIARLVAVIESDQMDAEPEMVGQSFLATGVEGIMRRNITINNSL